MWYFWWACRGNLKLITLGSGRVIGNSLVRLWCNIDAISLYVFCTCSEFIREAQRDGRKKAEFGGGNAEREPRHAGGGTRATPQAGRWICSGLPIDFAISMQIALAISIDKPITWLCVFRTLLLRVQTFLSAVKRLFERVGEVATKDPWKPWGHTVASTMREPSIQLTQPSLPASMHHSFIHPSIAPLPPSLPVSPSLHSSLPSINPIPLSLYPSIYPSIHLNTRKLLSD